MRHYVIAANWKMNKDASNGSQLASQVRSEIASRTMHPHVQVVLCPPFLLMDRIKSALEGSTIALGAQNMHFENDGAFTGEISGSMLRSFGCSHVILGHSERRQYFGETDTLINKKIQKALAVGLHPIVCVGETLAERESGVTERIVNTQVRGVLENVTSDGLKNLIIAYEPVWAIGTGRNATPAQAQEVHAFIRSLVAELYSPAEAKALIIQYGGSMKAENAKELLAQPDVDGGLIGGASLVEEQFMSIVDAANEHATAL